MGLKRTTKLRLSVLLLVVVSLLLVVIAWPREDLALKKIGINEPLKVRRGLDLQGGVYLVYQADVSSLPEGSDVKQVMENARAVIERRVNPGGASEAVVQTAANNRIVVQIPGADNPEEAKNTIGRTAQLSFYEVVAADGNQQIVPTEISGQDVDSATVDFAAQTSKPIVNLKFKGGESTDKFSAVTEKLSASGNQLVTLLDDQVVFGPANVEQPITNGEAQLSGDFNVKEANEIATLLNAGALPVPVSLEAQQTIGPTLGALSIKQSFVAALIGLLSICIFLIVYYRVAGFISVLSLLFYTAFMLSIIKLSVFTPYVLVLTLAGIAGFILGIAVAVDASILILERMKEEIARGASSTEAFEAGYTHALTSIRDANASSIISCFILYNFGAAIVKGFALTLGIGVALSLVTVLTVTKLLLRLTVRSRFASKPSWIGLPKEAKDV